MERMVVNYKGKPLNTVKVNGKEKATGQLILEYMERNGFKEEVRNEIICLELDACQIEYKSPQPETNIKTLVQTLKHLDDAVNDAGKRLGLEVSHIPVPSQEFMEKFIQKHNKSPERLSLYKKMVKSVFGVNIDTIPSNNREFFEEANKFGDTPKDVYSLIRPTRFGTIEQRYPDSTNDFKKVENMILEVKNHIVQVLFTSQKERLAS